MYDLRHGGGEGVPDRSGGPPGDSRALTHRMLLVCVLSAGVALWLRAVESYLLARSSAAAAAGPEYLALDAMLAVPCAGLAGWLAGAAPVPVTWRGCASHAARASLWLTAALVPLAPLRTAAHTLLGDGGPDRAAALARAGGAGPLGGALGSALAAEPVLFALALVTVGFLAAPVRLRGASRRLRRPTRRLALAATAGVTATALAGVPAQVLTAEPASASTTSTTSTLGCADPTVPTRTYDVVALHVDIAMNRYGDHDPFGYMYALAQQETAVRAFEAATTGPSPTATVSTGLREDPIQPLVLRARLGECVVVHFTNKVDVPPRAGNDQPVSGVPGISIDVQGVGYQIADGGSAVGQNPTTRMTPQNGTNTYRFYLDPLSGEGGKVFHSGGDARQLTAHGLFGAIIAEPPGSRWFDPETGADRTDDPSWNNWEAMVQPGSGPAFREFSIMYHEQGDDDAHLRRPLSEGPGADGLGNVIPMVDNELPEQTSPTDTGTEETDADGSGTNAYRPDGRAINYRSEPFWRRLQQLGRVAFPGMPAGQLDPIIKDKKALGYSSYTFGDPATPIPRSYLGEPTKTRLMHPGSEQLHVHHLHGGGDRWPANPRALDPNAFATGLKKDGFGAQNSIQLDSQAVGPDESYTLEHACGAGGCQQAAGDFLFHCHIAQHYIAGMWSFWRVFDTRQANLAPLPGRTAPPAGVTSDQLLGKTFEGRTVVLSVTDPATQVSLKDWVEHQLPPQGVRADHTDATVWDWAVAGTPDAPVYMTEPEDTRTWADFVPPHPGLRDPILFDPVNGRYAWPLMTPHLGMRPPFSPNGHGGAPWLGENASTSRPDGLCPAGAPKKTYDITAINVAIPETPRETDPDGRIFVLNEEKAAVLADPADRAVPLAIRSNVGDCVAITLSNEMHETETLSLTDGTTLTTPVQSKVNMHTHFVQFDPQASDGVITGMSYEQSVGDDQGPGNTTLAADVAAGATTVPVRDTAFLRGHDNVAVAVGEGRADIEIRTVVAVDAAANTVTLDRALDNAHQAGEPTGTEFVQYRWFSDMDSGTVFWHDHVDGITSWAHGLFGAHIIEPAGSTYHNPRTGAEIRSGTIADIWTNGSVGVGQSGSFREFMVFLSNGRRGRPELTQPLLGMDLNFGQECEESNINLRAEPIGERVPRAAQRDEWNGGVCRNDYVDPTTGALTSTNWTLQTVDPYVFSSVKYGDPATQLFRAYVGDPVVVRTIGTAERVEALRIQGHRFRRERFNGDGELSDTGTTGISERFDYVLDGGAGGPAHMPGDYLYYSTRNFAFESGGWGIFRVHDTRQPDLEVLPGRTAPQGLGFPKRTFTGQDPTGPTTGDSTAGPCPSTAPSRSYDVSVFNATLPSAPDDPTNTMPVPAKDPDGVVYALSVDEAAIRAGTKRLEPLVLRANVGDCVHVTLHNDLTAGSTFGGTRAGFSLAKLLTNPQQSGGAAVGFNPDTTVPVGGTRTYTFYADRQLGTSIFQNLGSEASMMHGAYGLFVTEPKGSVWLDNETGAFLGPNLTSTAAAIVVPFGRSFREFAVTMMTTDQHIGRSIIPYYEQVAGGTDDEKRAEEVDNDDEPPKPLAPGFPDDTQPGFTEINYHSAPVTQRIGPAEFGGDTSEDLGLALNNVHGVPETPLFRSYPGDPVVFRVAVPASQQLHTFVLQGHEFPWEPYMWDDATDHRSQLLTARALASGETMDAELVGGAGGTVHAVGDFRYGDGREQFVEAGLWGVFRVLPPPGSTASPSTPYELG